MKDVHIYLIPGFFGFSDIGGITYFHHVREYLEERLEHQGIKAVVRGVATLPTSSIERRAARLYAAIAEDDPQGDIHLIGHSTGGLDARVFASPECRVPDVDRDKLERYAGQIRSVVGVCAPHRGTPMAKFFESVSGGHLLYLLTLTTIYTLQFGKLPLGAVVALGGILVRLDDAVGLDNTIFDQIYDNLLDDFDAEREARVRSFLRLILEDRSLIEQLSPDSMVEFNATTPNRLGVRYGSVVMRAPTPGWDTTKAVGINPYHQATHLLYRGVQLLSVLGFEDPILAEEQDDAMRVAFGARPTPSDSDGIVPTLSHPGTDPMDGFRRPPRSWLGISTTQPAIHRMWTG
ncbi:MAG: triacylglycerol lipase [bacterium]